MVFLWFTLARPEYSVALHLSVMMMVAPNSRARKRGKYEELERSRRGMLTTGEWCNPVSIMGKSG